MASSMKDIKLRIHSVESTMQITKAMELVASSKLRRAQDQISKSRPYFETLYTTLNKIAASSEDLSSIYTQEHEVKRVCWIVIAGDRGLAGGYNNNVLKLAASQIEGTDSIVLPIGKKSVEFFRRRQIPILSELYMQAADLSVSDCFSMAKMLCKEFKEGRFDEIHIAYTDFISILAQQATTRKLLPLTVSCSSENDGCQDILYEPDSTSVFDMIVPEYLGGLVYGALCESIASELGARRTAMDSATNNAKEMIEDLSLLYNRARQGAITQEITEIVAGSQN